jgi:hypothetical protein
MLTYLLFWREYGISDPLLDPFLGGTGITGQRYPDVESALADSIHCTVLETKSPAIHACNTGESL